jgi:hypothetical protein
VKPTAIDVLHKPIGLLGQQSGPAWTRIGLRPYAVEAIAVAPHGGQTMLLGAEASGVRKSVDGGITWSGSHTGLTNLAVQGFAFDVSAVATVYTATAGGGLFRSDGAGATWQNLAPGLIASVVKNIDSGSTWTTIFSKPAVIFNITIHPTNAGVLYARALRWPRIVAVDTHLDRISCDRAQLGVLHASIAMTPARPTRWPLAKTIITLTGRFSLPFPPAQREGQRPVQKLAAWTRDQ